MSRPPEAALARRTGSYRKEHWVDPACEWYTVTVYGAGEPSADALGRQEFRHFVARIEWHGIARNGPGKDREAFVRELADLGYRMVRDPVPLDHTTSECVVRPVFKR